jgi:hypothetical protein
MLLFRIVNYLYITLKRNYKFSKIFIKKNTNIINIDNHKKLLIAKYNRRIKKLLENSNFMSKFLFSSYLKIKFQIHLNEFFLKLIFRSIVYLRYLRIYYKYFSLVMLYNNYMQSIMYMSSHMTMGFFLYSLFFEKLEKIGILCYTFLINFFTEFFPKYINSSLNVFWKKLITRLNFIFFYLYMTFSILFNYNIFISNPGDATKQGDRREGTNVFFIFRPFLKYLPTYKITLTNLIILHRLFFIVFFQDLFQLLRKILLFFLECLFKFVNFLFLLVFNVYELIQTFCWIYVDRAVWAFKRTCDQVITFIFGSFGVFKLLFFPFYVFVIFFGKTFEKVIDFFVLILFLLFFIFISFVYFNEIVFFFKIYFFIRFLLNFFISYIYLTLHLNNFLKLFNCFCYMHMQSYYFPIQNKFLYYITNVKQEYGFSEFFYNFFVTRSSFNIKGKLKFTVLISYDYDSLIKRYSDPLSFDSLNYLFMHDLLFLIDQFFNNSLTDIVFLDLYNKLHQAYSICFSEKFPLLSEFSLRFNRNCILVDYNNFLLTNYDSDWEDIYVYYLFFMIFIKYHKK